MTHEEDADVGISNNLDLNVEQDCSSPKSSNANGVSSSPLKHELLRLSMEFDSDEQAYRFYQKYAELAGFSVRKDWVNRSKVHGRVMSRKLTCSRQGHRKKDKRDAHVKKHRKETRTGCLAHMVVTRQPNGKYLVTQFEIKHNHADVDLTKAEKLLESLVSGNSDSNEVSGSESMKNSEIQSRLSLQLLGIRFFPPENCDNLQMEDGIFLGSRSTRNMKEGDAARLMCYFQRQHFMNPSFFYFVQLDIDCKVSNVLWADDNMIVEYSHFGDVVCLDTSCMRKTNSRPYVQFVGLNNHRQVVIFSAAFLYDDSIDSFKWLVRTFIEGMSGKKPKFILSDQDATVVQAIHALLPETSHSTCTWQVYLIALKHLRHMVKEYDSFSIDFRSCVFSHEQEEDFTLAWNLMVEKYGLRSNAWLKWMFREQEKWAVPYGRNTFFVERDGMHLVELLSDKLSSHLDPDTDVLLFFKHFQSVVNEQRYRELELALDTGKHTPVLIASAILLKQPSEIYTLNAFRVFQREYEKCLNVVTNKCGERDSRVDYKAKTYGRSREFSVVFNTLDGTVSCNCLKFEHVGFLCSHALRVLDHQNIKVVPSYYILKRWSKDARVSPSVENHVYSQDENNKSIIASRYKDLCRNIIKISARAAGSDPAFEYASRQLDEVMQGIERILNFKSLDGVKEGCSADDGLADDDIRTEYDGQDDADVLKEGAETEGIVPSKDQSNLCNEQFPSSSGGLRVRQSPPEMVLSVASPPTTYISSPSPALSLCPLTQGLYTIEANQMVQSMYQTSNLNISLQPNPNMFEHPNFYTNQNHSPRHAQFLQGSLIRTQFQDPMSNTTQMKPVMGDGRPPSSLLNFNHRHRAAGV